MYESQIASGAASIIVSLLGVILCVVGWLGSRMANRLDDLVDRIDEVKGDLHERINGIDIRLIKVETIITKE
jgi:hypothetical protein